MASVNETAGLKTELGAGLAAGVETLSLNQTVTFTLYVKMVLPLDGYVFWVNATLLTDTALYNAAQYNRLEYNELDTPLPKRVISVKGSLHRTSEVQMHEDRQIAVNQMIFTSLESLQDFTEINPQMMYIATDEGVKFAFNRVDNFYKQSDLYHYKGHALYSTMDTQLIETMSGFDTENVIVSNSLPIWLTLSQYFTMYPSYLVDQNLPPPYAAVDIKSTEAIQAAPRIFPNSSHYQLVRDSVKITIYGSRNYNALEFVDYVLDYSLNTDQFGIMNLPTIQDEKMTQTELGIIAMKKTVVFDISYYQQNIRDVAIQYIRSAFITFSIA